MPPVRQVCRTRQEMSRLQVVSPGEWCGAVASTMVQQYRENLGMVRNPPSGVQLQRRVARCWLAYRKVLLWSAKAENSRRPFAAGVVGVGPNIACRHAIVAARMGLK